MARPVGAGGGGAAAGRRWSALLLLLLGAALVLWGLSSAASSASSALAGLSAAVSEAEEPLMSASPASGTPLTGSSATTEAAADSEAEGSQTPARSPSFSSSTSLSTGEEGEGLGPPSSSAAPLGTLQQQGSEPSGEDTGAGKPLRVHLLRISARYNFNILKNKWWPEPPRSIVARVPVPPAWSVSPKKAMKSMRQAAFQRAPRGPPVAYPLQLASYPSSHLFRQHAAEYYLLLSLLTGLPGVEVVEAASDAEVVFVPFFSSVSYHASHRHKLVSRALVKELLGSSLWARANGSDHVLPALHPLALLPVWETLPTMRYVAVDFSSPSEQAAFLDKDVPAPYVSAMTPGRARRDPADEWARRPYLLFFRGNVARRKNGEFVRKGIGRAVRKEAGVVFQRGTLRQGPNATGLAENMMKQAKFCLAPEGDTTSSCRLFDSILAGCIPVVVSDDVDPPFEEVIDYTRFAIFVPTLLAHRRKYLVRLLGAISQRQWQQMHEELRKVQEHFLFSVPAKPGGAESMIWRSVALRTRGGLNWRFRKKRIAQVEGRLREAGLTPNNMVHRKRGPS